MDQEVQKHTPTLTQVKIVKHIKAMEYVGHFREITTGSRVTDAQTSPVLWPSEF